MLRLVENGDQKKFTRDPRQFSIQNSQATSKKKFKKVFWRAGKVKFTAIKGDASRLRVLNGDHKSFTIDTEIKAKRNNMISELITFRITKAKAKVKFGVKYLYGYQFERSSLQLISIRKRKRENIFGELISLSFPCQR